MRLELRCRTWLGLGLGLEQRAYEGLGLGLGLGLEQRAYEGALVIRGDMGEIWGSCGGDVGEI